MGYGVEKLDSAPLLTVCIAACARPQVRVGGVMSEKSARAKCGGPIRGRPGTGRPAVYCGSICRGSAGYEVRRLQRRLQALEERLSWLLHEPEDDHLDARQRRYAAERRAEVEAEVVGTESRLRELISETRGTRLSLAHEDKG